MIGMVVSYHDAIYYDSMMVYDCYNMANDERNYSRITLLPVKTPILFWLELPALRFEPGTGG